MKNYAKAFRRGNPSAQVIVHFDDADHESTDSAISSVASAALTHWGSKASPVSVYRLTDRIRAVFPAVSEVGQRVDANDNEPEEAAA